MDKRVKKAILTLDEKFSTRENKNKEPSPCTENCSCHHSASEENPKGLPDQKVSFRGIIRGYGFGSDNKWFFLLDGFTSLQEVEDFKGALVRMAKEKITQETKQEKELDEILRKTPSNQMPKV